MSFDTRRPHIAAERTLHPHQHDLAVIVQSRPSSRTTDGTAGRPMSHVRGAWSSCWNKDMRGRGYRGAGCIIYCTEPFGIAMPCLEIQIEIRVSSTRWRRGSSGDAHTAPCMHILSEQTIDAEQGADRRPIQGSMVVSTGGRSQMARSLSRPTSSHSVSIMLLTQRS